ncbi:DnaJ domain-containing protein [Cunninghamella echinulata]|nr:DnaJ domain-containing protein [Cunninghamella echinulata]
MFESTKPTPAPTKSSTNSYKNTSSSNIKQSQHTERTSYPPKPLRKNNEQYNNENDSSDDDILTNEKEWQRQQEIRRKNYLESLKKQKQNEQQQQQQQNNVPQPNSKPYVAKPTSFSSPLPPHPKEDNTPTSSENNKTIIGADIIKKVIKARNHGNDLYKLGYYGEAEKSYSQALAILPQIHDLSAIISNNRAAARLKNGQYRQCLIDCNFVIERARDRCRNEPKDKATTLEGGISFQWHDQLVKALHRKAAALEFTMRLKEAQSIYEELISIDLNDGKARQGLKRCQSSSTSPPTTTTSTTNKNAASSFTSPGYSHTASSTPSSSNKNNNASNYFNSNNNAVKEMRERQAKLAKEEAERLEKTDIVDMRIQSWKKGKEKNLRALLTTLDTVLWPSVQWQGATINELLEPKKVKMCYMKAIAKVHPDKLSSSATVEQRLLASGVFTVLNQAWDDFRTNNKM